MPDKGSQPKMTAPLSPKSAPQRIAFILLGDRNKASSRVRGYWIGEELEVLGHQVSYHNTQGRLDYLKLLAVILRDDVLIFQKQYTRYDVALMRIARRLGKRVFFDIDDAPSRAQREISKRNAETMMRESHGVFAGSHNLETFARDAGATVHFVPSGIRLANYQTRNARQSNGSICLGWIGNGAHYVEDLTQILEAPLRVLAAKYDIRLKIVGACAEPRLRDIFGGIEGLKLDLIDQVEWSDPNAVSAAVADFDIGLYPLIENPFNIYKCAFKALEYMATSIPVVASDVGANGDVISHETDGFLVHSTQDWIEGLSQLIVDEDKSRAFGRNGLAKIESHYSTSVLAHKITELM